MRQRVTVQRLSQTADAFGQMQPSWEDVGTYWAQIEPANGREVAIAQQLQSQVTHSIKMRHPVAITPKDRLLFNGRVFNITQVLNAKERNFNLNLLCTESV